MDELKICETCKHCFDGPLAEPCLNCIREILSLETFETGDRIGWEPREEENR